MYSIKIECDGLLNRCLRRDRDMIQKEYQLILKDVVSAFTEEFTTALDSLYVYGSVAKGNAVVGQSDLDICVVFKHDIQSLD